MFKSLGNLPVTTRLRAEPSFTREQFLSYNAQFADKAGPDIANYFREFAKENSPEIKVNPDTLFRSELWWVWHLWKGLGQPYYKIYPALMDALLETKLDIPWSQMRWPHGVFEIRVDVRNPRLLWPVVGETSKRQVGEMPLGSLLLSISPRDAARLSSGRKDVSAAVKHAARTIATEDPSRQPIVSLVPAFFGTHLHPSRMAVGGVRREEEMLISPGQSSLFVPTDIFSLQTGPDMTIEQSLQQMKGVLEKADASYLADPEPTYVAMVRHGHKVLETTFRMALAACMFCVSGHGLVEPDLVRKLKPDYHRAKNRNDKDTVDRYVKKSRDAGLTGCTLGESLEMSVRESNFLPVRGGGSSSGHSEPGSRGQLKYAHLRRWYTRWQHYGKRDEIGRTELKLIQGTIVRSDLPMKPRQGHTTKQTVERVDVAASVDKQMHLNVKGPMGQSDKES